MILYHGTGLSMFNAIREAGCITPRLAGDSGNWSHTVRSADGFVYLTDTYPWYFAACTGEETLAVLEVDVDEDNLYPDEDFVAQVLTMVEGGDLFDNTAGINPLDYQHAWEDSLKYLGNVAHLGEIPYERVKRYALVSDPAFIGMVVEPVIHIKAHQVLKERYQALNDLAFGKIDSYVDPILQLAVDAGAEVPSVKPFRIAVAKHEIRHVLHLGGGDLYVDFRTTE
jgi:hypothetical protein